MRELIDLLGYEPVGCVWELTLACNMRCRHCGSSAGHERPRELTTEEALEVCDDLAALGNRQMTLSGGEPLLRRDWDVLTRRLVDHGIRVNMVTNGFAVNDATVERAKAAGLSNFAVSLDGVRETHDRIRSVAGAFDHVLAAFEACARGGLPAAAVTTVFKWNLEELDRIYEILVERGVTLWQFQLAEPMGNMAAFHEGLIDLEDLPRVLDLYVRAIHAGKLRPYIADCLGYYSPAEFAAPRFPDNQAADFWTGCYAGCRVVGIRSNGDVTGCLSLRDDSYIEGNVLETSLPEIWNRPGAFAFNRKFRAEDLAGECAGCEYGKLCRGGCTSMSAVLAGRPHADPMCYQVLRRRQLEAAARAAAANTAPEAAGPARSPTEG